jgi:aspartate/methionine/tyrosine aminotransferase
LPEQRGFVPPPYPFDRLVELQVAADALEGGCVDLSIGTPCDPPSEAVVRALGSSGAEQGYPPSIGSAALRAAAAEWLSRRLGVEVALDQIAACIGTKELVAGVPHWLRLRSPARDTVLYPAVSYPTYAMGATLAGCRSVPFDDLDAIDDGDAGRAVCLWVNSPANPTGELSDLPGRTILEHGPDGVVAVHSLSKRSNLAGVRVGFYAGDPELVRYLAEVRKHAGFMVPGPVQAAAVVALDDDEAVEAQRAVYHRRLERLRTVLAAVDAVAPMPHGGFYLWAAAPDGDAWRLAKRLAADGGALVTPGEFFGPGGAGHVRVAAVQPDDRIELVAARLGVG